MGNTKRSVSPAVAVQVPNPIRSRLMIRCHSPLPVLHSVSIIAFMSLVIIFALVERLPIVEATRLAAELGWRFGLNIDLDANDGAVGSDLAEIEGMSG
jgi:hypothetical protein